MISEEEFLLTMKALVFNKYDASQAKAAIAWGVSPQYASMVIRGKKPPSALMLEDVGYSRHKVTVVNYKELNR